jgi:hypothetical protein
MTFKGHRNARVVKVEWEEFYLHLLLPLVIEHPKLLMTGGKDKVTQTINKHFKPSAQFIGDASLNVCGTTKHHESQKLMSPYTGRQSFRERIERRWADHRDRTRRRSEGISDVLEEADDLRKHENVKVQYQKALAYIRELTNHTFLRVVYLTSSHQAQIEYKEV